MSWLRVLIILFMLTILGIATAHQRIEATRLGYAAQRLQDHRSKLQEENRKLLYQINQLSAPDRLLRLAKEGKMNLVEPVGLLRLEASPKPFRGNNTQTPRLSR